MASQVNIFVDQGSDYSLDIEVNETSGANTNLTGYTVTSKFAKNYGTSNSYTIQTSITHANNGLVTLSLPASNTESLSSGKYVYDVKINNSSTNVTRRVQEGLLTLRPKVS